MQRLAIVAALLVTACSAAKAPSDLKLTDGWARETASGQSTAAAYVTISNNGTGADQLVGASSAIASHAMIHQSSAEDGVARMRHLDDGLAIPSKAALQLAPGGTHIMLMGLARPLKAGETVPLTLNFARSKPRQVGIRILDAATAGRKGSR